MTHPDYRGPLYCGCICAGKMAGDPDAAVEREEKVEECQRRRKKWLTRKMNKPNVENRSIDAALSRLIDSGLVEKRITGYVRRERSYVRRISA